MGKATGGAVIFQNSQAMLRLPGTFSSAGHNLRGVAGSLCGIGCRAGTPPRRHPIVQAPHRASCTTPPPRAPTLRSGLLLSEAQLPNSGAGSGGCAASDGGVTGKLKGSANNKQERGGWGR